MVLTEAQKRAKAKYVAKNKEKFAEYAKKSKEKHKEKYANTRYINYHTKKNNITDTMIEFLTEMSSFESSKS